MGILASIYALLGIGGTAYCAGSGIKNLFKRELSNDEFIEMFKEEQATGAFEWPEEAC